MLRVRHRDSGGRQQVQNTLQFDIDFNRNNDWKKPSGLGQGNFNQKVFLAKPATRNVSILEEYKSGTD